MIHSLIIRRLYRSKNISRRFSKNLSNTLNFSQSLNGPEHIAFFSLYLIRTFSFTYPIIDKRWSYINVAKLPQCEVSSTYHLTIYCMLVVQDFFVKRCYFQAGIIEEGRRIPSLSARLSGLVLQLLIWC
jgi:hypothetical protein